MKFGLERKAGSVPITERPQVVETEPAQSSESEYKVRVTVTATKT